MKYIILLVLLASCGQHKEPKAVDQHDRDGDQIYDGLEEGFLKHIATKVTLENIEMTITLRDSGSKKFIFKNRFNTENLAMEYMTAKEADLPLDHYFTENGRLKLTKNLDEDFKPKKVENISFSLKHKGATPKFLQIFNKSGKVDSYAWKDDLNLDISDELFNELLKGEAYFTFATETFINPVYKKSVEETIQENTYPVFVKNSNAADVYYVSKQLSEEKLEKYLGIESPVTISKKLLLGTIKPEIVKPWWKRKTSTGTLVYIKADQNYLMNFHLNEHFTMKEYVLHRAEGVSTGALKLPRTEGAMVIKMRATGVSRHFMETTGSKSFIARTKEDAGIKTKCKITSRNITLERNFQSTDEGLFENIILSDEAGSLVENYHKNSPYRISSTEHGSNVVLESSASDIEIRLRHLPEETFTKIGSVSYQCDNTVSKPDLDYYRVNKEAQLKLEIEAYVEKL